MTSPWSWEAAPSRGRKDSLAWFSGSASASHPFTVCYLGVCPWGRRGWPGKRRRGE